MNNLNDEQLNRLYDRIEQLEKENEKLKEGYKWLARNEGGKLFTHSAKPVKGSKIYCSDGYISCVCGEFVPIFQNIKFEDSEPTSIESIVHPQILDDAERRYLSAVIRPFKDRVGCICKTFYTSEYQHIYIVLRDCNYNMYLPIFKKGTMYKGMEFGRSYSLEELGL